MNIFVARQPIFDSSEKLYGYELLYRSNAVTTIAGNHDGNTMSARVIANVFLGMDLRQLTGEHPAFVNLTGEQLLEKTYQLFDTKDVVIEVLESCDATDEMVAAVQMMKEEGFTIALDDFEPEQSNVRLLEYASIVKIDVLNRDDDVIRRVVDFVKPYGVRLLAERVETAEVYARCRAMGFELFQGYFHARPVTISAEDVEASQTSTMQLLNLLRDPDATDANIEQGFTSDPALCYKLMRIVNSAAMGSKEVKSVQHAARLVGRGMLYRWLSILFTASFADGTDNARELVLVALGRGRLCELVASTARGAVAADAMFMTGLLSSMDVLMRVPMERVLAGINVPVAVSNALLFRSGEQAPTLMLAEAYESGDWEQVRSLSDRLGLEPDAIGALYVDSVRWAEEQLTGQAA